MLLSELRQTAEPLDEPFDGIVLNRNFTLQGREAVLASLSFQGLRATLWILVKWNNPAWFREGGVPSFATNRDERLWGMYTGMFPNISSVEIEGRLIFLQGFRTLSVWQKDGEALEQFRRFFTQGADLSIFNETDMEDICIIPIGFPASILPSLSVRDDMRITIHTREEWREFHTSKVFTLRLGETPPDERLSFYDEYAGCERYYYINGLEEFNPWQQNEEILNQPEFIKDNSEEELAQLKEQFKSGMASWYASGNKTILVKYETEDGISLNFYTTQYLDTEYKHEHSYSDSMVVGTRGDEGGPHGCTQQNATLGTQFPIDFDEPVQFELLSCRIPVPGETIQIY